MVKTLDQYIAEGDIDGAVEVVYRGMINAFNIYCPGVGLTKENLEILATPLKNKFLGIVDPAPKPGDEYERTPEPGDDIDVVPARGQLTIVYTCDDEIELPDPIAEMVTVGQEYYYESPAIEGYAVEPAVVEGKMTTAGATVTVVYTAVTEEKEAKYGSVEIIQDDLKAETHEKSVVSGDKTAKTVATISEDVLEWAKAGSSSAHSEELSGWWAGIKVTKADGADDSGAIRVYRYDGTYEEYTVKKAFTEDFKMFGYVTPERLDAPNGSDGKLTYTIKADWNNDGVFEQEIALKIDPATVVLKMKAKDTEAVWPEKK